MQYIPSTYFLRSVVVAGLLERLSKELKIRSERAWNSSQVQEQYRFEDWRVINYEEREISKREHVSGIMGEPVQYINTYKMY